MSRNLKRVPLNFVWPIGQLWDGYVNPYNDLAVECPDCVNGHDRVGGRPDANAALFHDQWYGLGHVTFDPVAYGAEPLSPYAPAIWRLASRNVGAPSDFYEGNAKRIARAAARHKKEPDDPLLVPFPAFDKERAINQEARRLYALWRCQWQHHLVQADIDALLAEERLWDLTSTWSKDGWQPREDGHHPTAAEVNAWSLEGFGHDTANCFICVKARCAREGVAYECMRCHGSGNLWPSPEIEKQCENWQPTDPPTGEGYQLWEDCSEGRPVSPVFTSLEALCAWAADHATTFGPERATAKEWKQMLEEDFVHADDEQGNVYQ